MRRSHRSARRRQPSPVGVHPERLEQRFALDASTDFGTSADTSTAAPSDLYSGGRWYPDWVGGAAGRGGQGVTGELFFGGGNWECYVDEDACKGWSAVGAEEDTLSGALLGNEGFSFSNNPNTRAILQRATTVMLDPSVVGPNPVEFLVHDTLPSPAESLQVNVLVVLAVADGVVVEKRDTPIQWDVVGAPVTSSKPSELLKLLQTRVLQDGDSIRVRYENPVSSAEPAPAFAVVRMISYGKGAPGPLGAPVVA